MNNKDIKEDSCMETIAGEFYKWLKERTNLKKNSVDSYKTYIKRLCENVNKVFGTGWFEALHTDPAEVSVYKRKQCAEFIEFCIQNVSKTKKQAWTDWRSAFRQFEDFLDWKKTGKIAQHVPAPLLAKEETTAQHMGRNNMVITKRVQSGPAGDCCTINSEENLRKTRMSGSAWGYLREDAADANRAGFDAGTGLHRTGLEDYLRVVFPDTTDWIHDKGLPRNRNTKNRRIRPDYRSESLNLIVEFDGLPHFQYPAIIADLENTEYYKRLGYHVVRIPYFIQLTKDAVAKYFGVDVGIDLFNPSYPSLTGSGKWMPSHICSLGLMRMALEFVRFPDQYQINKELMSAEQKYTGYQNLDGLYQCFKTHYPTGIPDSATMLSVVIKSHLSLIAPTINPYLPVV